VASIRFLQNTILDVTSTVVDEQGSLSVVTRKRHFKLGEVYAVESFQKQGTMFTAVVTDGSSFSMDSGVCEFLTAAVKTGKGGCGGCGNRSK
jgi:hypothetical protein